MPRPLLRGLPARLASASRWRRVGPAILAVAGVAVVLGAIAGGSLPGSSQGASRPRGGSGATATVQRRDLVATDTEAGTLSYASPHTVYNRLSGTITSLPTVGAVIKPGQRLYDVDGAPVVLFDGTVPAYRSLSAGVTDGLDVEQLKRNLVALGFDPNHQITIDQTFDSATTTAVDAWQASLGGTQTGTVTLGQVVFLPGVQRITSIDTTLGSTGGGGSSGSGSSSSGSGSSTSGASTTASSTASTQNASFESSGVPRTEFASYTTTIGNQTDTNAKSATAAACPSKTNTTTTTTTPTTTTPATTCPPTTTPATTKKKPSSPTAQQLLAELVAQLKKLASSSSRSASTGTSGRSSSGSASASGSASRSGSGGASSSGSSGGSSGGASASGSTSSGVSGTAQAILQTTSNQVIVSVQLDATKQSEAVVHEPVTVQLPDGSTVNGRITEVSPVAQSSSSSSSSGSGGGGSSTPTATIPVTIAITGRQPTRGLDQAAVSVNFEQQVERNVLSVPVTALLATAGGHYAVQEANAPHSLIPVTPGLFAAGYVQVDGSQIYPGLQITDSQG